MKKATKMVVVIGETTHKSKWVNWEIQTFYDMKSNLEGDATKRIRAMLVKGSEGGKLPRRIKRLGISTMIWNLQELSRWLNLNPNQ